MTTWTRFSNDRAQGVGRHTLRVSAQINASLFLSYRFALGRKARGPAGIGVFGGGQAVRLMSVPTIEQDTAGYRVEIQAAIFNVLNRRDYLGYSGVLTSPFFGQATAATGMRMVDVGVMLPF
jgi:hypothetical protein